MAVEVKGTTAESPEKSANPAGPSAGGFGVRHVQILLLFLGMALGYIQRAVLSVAIVPMVNSTSANPDFQDYGWDTSQSSAVQSSFFWGYVVTQVPCGYIAKVWSAQKLISINIFCAGVLTLLIPMSADLGGWIGVCICRVGKGLFQACLIPCTQTLVARWVPEGERARLASFAYAGAPLGTVIALPSAGLLASSNAGWPSIFYLFGALSMLWGVVFFFRGADFPAVHPSISEKERKYIEANVGSLPNSDGSKPKLSIPWKQIFTSVPAWAIIIAHCCHNWGYWLLLTEMPLYMNSVLEFDIQQNGFLSALPYLAMWIFTFPASWLADYALKKGIDKSWTRKVANSVSQFGPAAALIGLAFVPSGDRTMAVGMLVLAVAINGAHYCGFMVNHIDLSPNFAGTLMSITNDAAAFIGILAPLICGEIVTVPSDSNQWKEVFFISAGIYVIGNLAFIFLGKTTIQWWNDPEEVQRRRKGRVPADSEAPSQINH